MFAEFHQSLFRRMLVVFSSVWFPISAAVALPNCCCMHRYASTEIIAEHCCCPAKVPQIANLPSFSAPLPKCCCVDRSLPVSPSSAVYVERVSDSLSAGFDFQCDLLTLELRPMFSVEVLEWSAKAASPLTAVEECALLCRFLC